MKSTSTKTQRPSTAINKGSNQNNENKKSFFEKITNNTELEILNLIQRELNNESDLNKVTAKITKAQINDQEKQDKLNKKKKKEEKQKFNDAILKSQRQKDFLSEQFREDKKQFEIEQNLLLKEEKEKHKQQEEQRKAKEQKRKEEELKYKQKIAHIRKEQNKIMEEKEKTLAQKQLIREQLIQKHEQKIKEEK